MAESRVMTYGLKKRYRRKQCREIGSCKAADRHGNLKRYRAKQVYIGERGGKYIITRGNRRAYVKSRKARETRGKTHIGGGMYA